MKISLPKFQHIHCLEYRIMLKLFSLTSINLTARYQVVIFAIDSSCFACFCFWVPYRFPSIPQVPDQFASIFCWLTPFFSQGPFFYIYLLGRGVNLQFYCFSFFSLYSVMYIVLYIFWCCIRHGWFQSTITLALSEFYVSI